MRPCNDTLNGANDSSIEHGHVHILNDFAVFDTAIDVCDFSLIQGKHLPIQESQRQGRERRR
jgi:hypothetical protein